MNTIRQLLIMACMIGFPYGHAFALGPWPFERLNRESELVVICTVESTSVVESDSGYGENVYDMYESRFAPVAVLRGNTVEPTLTLRHFDVKAGNNIGGRPHFFRFVGPAVIESERSYIPGSDNLYLIFLKRLGDHYVPTSDQRSAADSIVQLSGLTPGQRSIDLPTIPIHQTEPTP